MIDRERKVRLFVLRNEESKVKNRFESKICENF